MPPSPFPPRLILKKLHDRPNAFTPQPMTRVRNKQRILHRAHLPPKLTLAIQIEAPRNTVERRLQHFHLRGPHVVPRREMSCCSPAEGHGFDAQTGRGVEGVGGDILDGARGRTGEVEGVFRLPAVVGGQLREDGDADDSALFVLREEVSAMALVAEEVDDR